MKGDPLRPLRTATWHCSCPIARKGGPLRLICRLGATSWSSRCILLIGLAFSWLVAPAALRASPAVHASVRLPSGLADGRCNMAAKVNLVLVPGLLCTKALWEPQIAG